SGHQRPAAREGGRTGGHRVPGRRPGRRGVGHGDRDAGSRGPQRTPQPRAARRGGGRVVAVRTPGRRWHQSGVDGPGALTPFVILEPGQLASASISWSGWRGRSASGRIVVSWEGGSATVDAAGPIEPGPPERGV